MPLTAIAHAQWVVFRLDTFFRRGDDAALPVRRTVEPIIGRNEVVAPGSERTISDVILHIRYTARMAGDPLGAEATKELAWR